MANTLTISYFLSWFHAFDAIVVIGAFVIELTITDPMEQAGSLVIILRLWRVFKIVGEISAGAEEEMAALQKQIEKLKHKNEEILKENHDLRAKVQTAAGTSTIDDANSHDSGR